MIKMAEIGYGVLVVLYVLLWLGGLAAFVVAPVWLAALGIRAVRRRGAVPWRTRVGDRERAAVARRLGEDYAAGRLSLPELESRVDASWHAATFAELRAIASDLPPARPLRTFGAFDLALAFAAGLALLAVSPLVAVLVACAIVLRRRMA